MALREYEQSLLMLSAESINPALINPDVGKRLWDIMGGVKEVLRETINDFTPLKMELYQPDTTLTRVIGESNYMEISNTTVFVPLGLNIPWLDYIALLGQATAIAENLEEKVLKPTKVYVNQLLASPEKMQAVTLGLLDKNIQYNTVEIDRLKRAFSNAFVQGATDPLVPYKKVFKRNADCCDASTELQKITTRISALNNKKIIEHVSELCETLDRIMLRIRTDPETYAVNNITADTLGNRIYQVACEIEFMAAVKTYVQAAQTCMTDTMKKLKSNLR